MTPSPLTITPAKRDRQESPMTSLQAPTFTQALKLASLAVHAEELLDMQAKAVAGDRDTNHAIEFDRGAIVTLLADPDVRALLDDPENRVYLPAKRDG